MKLLITAGPTREALDPVRYLSNRSSGKMGYALAQAAVDAGHEVTLVSGPVSIPEPAGVKVLRVESAQQMHDAVRDRISNVDAAIFAAAVADYRPVQAAAQKLKKSEPHLTLQLERTPDILGSAREVFHFGGLLVGFAAETENLIDYARSKLERKQCDLIVANDVSDKRIGFDSDQNAVTLITRDGRTTELAAASKAEIARQILLVVEQLAAKG